MQLVRYTIHMSDADLNHLLVAARRQSRSSVLLRQAIAKKHGLNASDAECLDFLLDNGYASATDIVRYTGLTKGSVTTMLDRLERRGFIKREVSDKDRRGIVVGVNVDALAPMITDYGRLSQATYELFESYDTRQQKLICSYLDRSADLYQELLRDV